MPGTECFRSPIVVSYALTGFILYFGAIVHVNFPRQLHYRSFGARLLSSGPNARAMLQSCWHIGSRTWRCSAPRHGYNRPGEIPGGISCRSSLIWNKFLRCRVPVRDVSKDWCSVITFRVTPDSTLPRLTYHQAFSIPRCWPIICAEDFLSMQGPLLCTKYIPRLPFVPIRNVVLRDPYCARLKMATPVGDQGLVYSAQP